MASAGTLHVVGQRSVLLDSVASTSDIMHEESTTPTGENEIGTAGLLETIWNMLNNVIGAGMLTLPYCLKLAGWSGLLVIIFFYLVSLLTALALGWTLSNVSKELDAKGVPHGARDFAILGEMSMGKFGRNFVAFIILLENWSSYLLMLDFVGVNLHHLLGLSKLVGIIGSGVLTILLLYIPLKWLSYVGMVGMVFAFVSASMLVVEGVEKENIVDRVALDLSGVATAGGMILFVYSGHSCLPSIYWSMQRPDKDYTRACGIGYSMIVIFYGALAGLAYFYFGDQVANTYTESIQSEALLIASTATIVVKVQATAPLCLVPCVQVLENLLGIQSCGGILAVRLVLGSISIVMAIFSVKLLTVVVAFSGYIATSYDSLIFPGLVACLLMDQKSLSNCYRLMLKLVVVLGVLLATMGTVVTLVSGDY